jgi:hypothetical protein
LGFQKYRQLKGGSVLFKTIKLPCPTGMMRVDANCDRSIPVGAVEVMVTPTFLQLV